ncbi:uncharacterized protein BXZ73DRAFT_93654 [Epithele typhae]|uniref:uncharacterized protein n=1 Tax=Epithele typhae TaxID=378194 RepID=UPI002007D98A|nr:uncharacterized protein BXZ73DRAFT_93654 [Epithele typhae]KAH9910621.1 hypothetical protein BXZ73DRAFT_93654 [Epithele typhae]
MKSYFAAIVLSALAFSVHALPSCPYSSTRFRLPRTTPTLCCDSTVPLFRLYSPSATDHFYTTNAQERNNAVASIGYTNEGTAAQVFPAGVSGAVPLYRLFRLAGSDHFYTTNAQERDNAVAALGYTNEGVAAYIYPSAQCGSVPLYRMFSPSAVDHFYTTNVAEKNNAVASLGYSYEGVAGYVNPVKGAHC